MTSNWYAKNSVCDSQSFTLRLSEGSTVEDFSLQRFPTRKKTEDKDDIIVISDSSCSSSPECIDTPKSSSTSNVRNKKYQKLQFLEISSSKNKKEEDFDSSWEFVRSDNQFSYKTPINKTTIQVNKASTETSLISNDTSSTSDRLFDALLTSNDALTNDKITISSNVNYDRNQVNKSKRSTNQFSYKTPINKTTIQVNKASTETSLISNDTSSTSDRLFDALLTSNDALTNDKITISSNVNYDRNQVNKSKRSTNKSKKHINDRSLTEQELKSKPREKYNTDKTNKVIEASCNSPNILSRHPTYNTPKQNSTGKIKLTKKDTYKILKNIKSTQVVYDSSREKKETNVIINESTDIEEDIMHPAISSSYNNKVQSKYLSNSPDVINISLKNDILQTDLSEPSKSCNDISKIMDSHRPLSEKRKRQIREWLLTNFPDSQSDSSFNTIPPSTRNSNSGNSSLERLEQNYETPNNREKINKTRTDEKQRTIVNSDRVVHSFLTRQTTLDQYFKKSKNNDSEFRTPVNKSKLLPKAQTDKKASSVVNKSETKDIMDCANILDKLYGISWRDKANALLPTTESRKTSIEITNRTVQTERKPVSRNQYRIIDSNSDESDLVENNIKLNRGRNIQRKQKEMDNFINDESLSGSDDESIYYSAITNPTIFTSSTTKSMQVPASIKRLQALCDTDTEDEDDKAISNKPKNLHRRKLSFSDDESSSTSEFDPGDYVPPKYVHTKEVIKRPQPSKIASKFESTTTKPAGYETFLASLSNTVSMNNAHPNAKKYRLDYKNYKEELCKKLYEVYNEKVFDNKLPRDMSIEWNVRMRGTAGYCYNKKSVKSLSNVVKSSRIVLATKILDTPDRLRDTLIHEMCHAASWIIDDISDGHGPCWSRWANKAMRIFPELPPIRRCHNYEIKTKFTYKCTGCGYSIGRHSKSLDIEKKRCGYCYGKFELLINKTTKSGTVQVQTPKREPTGFALYVKQNYNSVKKEKGAMRHADVMKLLGQQFSAIKIAKQTDMASN